MTMRFHNIKNVQLSNLLATGWRLVSNEPKHKNESGHNLVIQLQIHHNYYLLSINNFLATYWFNYYLIIILT
jgi:hypothetical protein